MHLKSDSFRTALVAASMVLLSCGTACGASEVESADDSDGTFHGGAHWYGNEFHGKKTASGAVFDKHKLTAAHPHLRFGTLVRVKSKHTNKDVIVEITDRCPPRKDRVIDLSEAAAKQIGIWPTGRNAVECSTLPTPAKKVASKKSSVREAVKL